MTDRQAQGMATRRKVLGDAHVDRAEAAWGHVWSRDTISPRERSMLTIALLAGLGNFDEIPMHVRATANTGASRADVMEALLHVAIYAGVPRANHAIRIARDTFDAMEARDD